MYTARDYAEKFLQENNPSVPRGLKDPDNRGIRPSTSRQGYTEEHRRSTSRPCLPRRRWAAFPAASNAKSNKVLRRGAGLPSVAPHTTAEVLLRTDVFIGGDWRCIVPRSRGKIPRISLRSIEPICLTKENWRAVERGYGQALSPEVRQQIITITNSFIRSASAENTGSISDAIKRATLLRKQSQALVSTINERAVGDVTREYVDDELTLSYARINHDKRCEFLGASSVPLAARKYIRELNAELQRFVEACDMTLRELDHAALYNYWPEGGAWSAWIQQLTRLVTTYRLPTGVSKDFRSRTSPFVALVDALQAFVPRKYARPRSIGALAEAIHKARQGRKPSVELRKGRAKKSGLNTND
jgi:hypothetical protein